MDADEDSPDDNWDDLGPEGVMNRVATFLACLRSRSSQTFSSVNYVLQETSSLIHNIVTDLQNKTMSVFQRLGQEDLPEVKVLREEFNIASEPFKDLESHVKQIKYFTQSGNFIEPIEEVFPGVSYMSQRASDTGVVRQVAVQDTFQRVPLSPLLQKILECLGVLQAALQMSYRVFVMARCGMHMHFFLKSSLGSAQ